MEKLFGFTFGYGVSLVLISLAKTTSVYATQPDSVYSKLGLVQTANNFGWMATQLEPMSKAFIEFSKTSELPVLDIGTAFGYVPSLLVKSKIKVIANDIYRPHLDSLYSNTPDEFRKLLSLNTDRFPDQLELMPNSIGAILASRVFHFLTGEELELGVKKMFDWLVPGGKVFVFTNAPYRKNMTSFMAEYEKKRAVEKYPGMVENVNSVNKEQGKYLAPFFHYMDKDVVSRLFIEAGFIIEKVDYVKIDLPEDITLDGRENVGLIAVKPLRSRL